jgi:hypothetical protein
MQQTLVSGNNPFVNPPSPYIPGSRPGTYTEQPIFQPSHVSHSPSPSYSLPIHSSTAPPIVDYNNVFSSPVSEDSSSFYNPQQSFGYAPPQNISFQTSTAFTGSSPVNFELTLTQAKTAKNIFQTLHFANHEPCTMILNPSKLIFEQLNLHKNTFITIILPERKLLKYDVPKDSISKLAFNAHEAAVNSKTNSVNDSLAIFGNQGETTFYISNITATGANSVSLHKKYMEDIVKTFKFKNSIRFKQTAKSFKETIKNMKHTTNHSYEVLVYEDNCQFISFVLGGIQNKEKILKKVAKIGEGISEIPLDTIPLDGNQINLLDKMTSLPTPASIINFSFLNIGDMYNKNYIIKISASVGEMGKIRILIQKNGNFIVQ